MCTDDDWFTGVLGFLWGLVFAVLLGLVIFIVTIPDPEPADRILVSSFRKWDITCPTSTEKTIIDTAKSVLSVPHFSRIGVIGHCTNLDGDDLELVLQYSADHKLLLFTTAELQDGATYIDNLVVVDADGDEDPGRFEG